MPLGVRVSLRLENTVERRASANVIGRLPASDPSVEEVVLYTAHHDHLGVRPGNGEGTAPEIYNGALDNASGLAMMLAIAEAFAVLPGKPDRSILFAAVGAEEQGLSGFGSTWRGTRRCPPAALRPTSTSTG